MPAKKNTKAKARPAPGAGPGIQKKRRKSTPAQEEREQRPRLPARNEREKEINEELALTFLTTFHVF